DESEDLATLVHVLYYLGLGDCIPRTERRSIFGSYCHHGVHHACFELYTVRTIKKVNRLEQGLENGKVGVVGHSCDTFSLFFFTLPLFGFLLLSLLFFLL